jgi:hypothetical protein
MPACLEPSLGRRRPNQPLGWRRRQERGAALASVPLVGVVQPATLVAGTTGECAAVASVRLVGVCSDSHCGGGHDR